LTISELRKLLIEWSTTIGVSNPASDAFHKRDQALALLDNLNQAAITFAGVIAELRVVTKGFAPRIPKARTECDSLARDSNLLDEVLHEQGE
jgi:hypothetical protein